MLGSLARRLQISPAVAVILLVLTLIQVALQVYALLDLARRNRVPGGNKWVWAAIVVLFGLPGAIGYLAVARTSSTMEDPTASTTKVARKEGVERAVDALYGKRDRR